MYRCVVDLDQRDALGVGGGAERPSFLREVCLNLA
jgi:hypothetical protein